MLNSSYPLVSVIIPVRNEEKFIERNLQALLLQDYPSIALEILIADGNSTDGTKAIIAAIAKAHPAYSITVVENYQKTMPAGFNRALMQAGGSVIVMLGGHAVVALDYISRCIETLERIGADCVGGPITTVGETWMARVISLAQSSPFGVGGVAFRMADAKASYVDTVAFGAYRRDVFERIGPLDEELVRNQDDEFNFRLTQAGGKIWLDPAINSTYYSRATLGKLWRQYYQYGLYKVRVIQKRGAVPSWRHLVPAAFVVTLIGSVLLSVFTGSRLWLALILVPYLLANLAASVWAARSNVWALPLLPIVIVILHVAYGLGFLWGLWRWRAYGFPKLKLAGKVS